MVFEATDDLISKLNKCTRCSVTIFKTDEYGFKCTGRFNNTNKGRSIFFLGDSFTEGLYINPPETFVGLFESKLNEDIVDNDMAVYNLGVNGYGALEECWMLEEYCEILNPAIIVVNLFSNDVDVDYSNVIKGIEDYKEGYAELFYYLERMRLFCLAKGIDLTITTIPPYIQRLKSLKGNSEFNNRVRAFCVRQNISFLDPYGYFQEHDFDSLYFGIAI